MKNYTEVFVLHKSKPHRAYYPINSDEFTVAELLSFPEQTHVYFDRQWVILLSQYPIQWIDVQFVIRDIREMHGQTRTGMTYCKAIGKFMERYFGWTTAWYELSGDRDALRVTYEWILKSDAAFYEFVRGGDHA